jgi:hypothetical protein
MKYHYDISIEFALFPFHELVLFKKSMVFYTVTPCNWENSWHFRGIYGL